MEKTNKERLVHGVFDHYNNTSYSFHEGYIIKKNTDQNVHVVGIDSSVEPMEENTDVFCWLDSTKPEVTVADKDTIEAAMNVLDLMFEDVVDKVGELEKVIERYQHDDHVYADLIGTLRTRYHQFFRKYRGD
jgi:hypothetical protein